MGGTLEPYQKALPKLIMRYSAYKIYRLNRMVNTRICDQRGIV